jgi:hypothetical protein
MVCGTEAYHRQYLLLMIHTGSTAVRGDGAGVSGSQPKAAPPEWLQPISNFKSSAEYVALYNDIDVLTGWACVF